MADRNDVSSMAPEEYSELKRQEKAEVFELLSAATQKLIRPDGLKAYADKQAQLLRHSVSNVLLIMEQDPEATWVRTYDDWKADGVAVLKGEAGLRTLGSYRFQKEDGTIGMGSKVVKMFDVKQTAIKDFDIEGPGYRKVPEVITGIYPASVEVQDLPNGELAVYDPDDRLIRVKEGLDPMTKMFVVTREVSMYHLADFHENGREETMAEAELAAYILVKHYGFDTPDADFSKLTETYPGKEEKAVRAELGRIKFACDRVDEKVREALELDRGSKAKDNRDAR
ncbi:MAG: hypothetical protein J6D57_08500 [Mogibacterium sp.]|nr:hypothetical protein [Mogibacterium sp.]